MQSQDIAVVTGANRGIGLEVCRQLATAGIDVILTARRRSEGRKACRQLAEEGLKATFHPLDVTSERSIRRLARYIERRHGRLDILINNAVVANEKRKPLHLGKMKVIRTILETNAMGPLTVIRELLPLLRQAQQGRIVNVSSGAGALKPISSDTPAYRLSKLMLNVMSIIMAEELQDTNITVNCAYPGWVRTDLGGKKAPRSIAEGADTVVWLALEVEGKPTGKLYRDRGEIEW